MEAQTLGCATNSSFAGIWIFMRYFLFQKFDDGHRSLAQLAGC